MRMQKLGVRSSDLIETFVLGSGRGGQKLNKTASCVCLRHAPSGIVVKCQAARSRELNRFLARRLLCERLDELVHKEKSAKRAAAERIRRQKQRRSRRQKEKMLKLKRHHAQIKSLRKTPSIED